MTVVPFSDPAERKLIAAMREHLAYVVRNTNDPDWETDPEYALLEIMRVALSNICYEPFDFGDDGEADYEVSNRIAMLVRKLDRLKYKRRAALADA
jgi:hypothetical protein